MAFRCVGKNIKGTKSKDKYEFRTKIKSDSFLDTHIELLVVSKPTTWPFHG